MLRYGILAATAVAGFSPQTTAQQVTTKIPPAYDGTTLWFTYEEQVLEWSDLTELHGEKRGLALKSRVTGAAAVYKHFLDRDQLLQKLRKQVRQLEAATGQAAGGAQAKADDEALPGVGSPRANK